MLTYIKISPKKVFNIIKVAAVALTLAFSMPFETKAYKNPIVPGKVRTYGDDSESYLYAGLLVGFGAIGFKADHPKLYAYKDLNPYCFSGMLGLLAGCQITKYIAMETSFEFIGRHEKFQRIDSYRHDCTPRKVESNIYTVGLALDIVPAIPVSDEASLLAVMGVGYKTAGVELLSDKPFTNISWWMMPRLGLGVNLGMGADVGHLTIKLLGELNDAFQAKSEAILSPSFVCCLSLCFNFK